MKGKSRFTSAEATQIRQAVERLRSVGRDEQKKIRAKLRAEQRFFITDFTNQKKGFTVEDFNDLVSLGTITIG